MVIFILFSLFLGVVIWIFSEALLEKPPGHPLDFQDINGRDLQGTINSVEDGLPYAMNRAHEWRQDAVLTGLLIISFEEEEIRSANGEIIYTFHFPYIDESKPRGFIDISIDTRTNSLQLVSAYHNPELRTTRINELNSNNLTERIEKVYDVAMEAIGEDNVFKYKEPFVKMDVDSSYAYFELSPSRSEPNKIQHRIKIDMTSYEIKSQKNN
jgi:hypothetical protein